MLFRRGAFLGQVPLVGPRSVWEPRTRDWFEPPPFNEAPPQPPFFVKYAGPATGGKFITAGPFATSEEAFDYAGPRYGGSAPSVGHIEVEDSLGRVVIIT